MSADLTIAEIRQLRERSGAPMMACKDALLAEAGDQDRAYERLRVKRAGS
nr:hypothetical protein [Rhodococcus sp. (in: high G+C Gram-positive bacteria)]